MSGSSGSLQSSSTSTSTQSAAIAITGLKLRADLELGDDDEGADQSQGKIRVVGDVAVGHQKHVGRVIGQVGAHALSQRHSREEGTGQQLDDPKQGPAGSGENQRGPPLGVLFLLPGEEAQGAHCQDRPQGVGESVLQGDRAADRLRARNETISRAVLAIRTSDHLRALRAV
jgi:hypothetical protein